MFEGKVFRDFESGEIFVGDEIIKECERRDLDYKDSRQVLFYFEEIEE